MTIPACPLAWPPGWRRRDASNRTTARFSKKEKQYSRTADSNGGRASWMTSKELTIAEAVSRLRTVVKQMGVSDNDLVISTNLELRLDGFPRSGQREPNDPGAAVYWRDRGATRCMAIDRYNRVADNLAAIAATLDAMRAIERHGGAEILDRAFTGFSALPPPAGEAWWDVLGVPANARPAEIKAAYQRKRSAAHPDNGGTSEQFDAVTRAYEQATAGGAA